MSPNTNFPHDWGIKVTQQYLSGDHMKICKWYDSCPVKYFTDKSMLERFWVENYCMGDNTACVRYQMEENFEPHPDNMLPSGEIREDLR